ncbi:MAG: hypothetical protein WC479_03060 [Candidatus Izemoplasmatales bacterium]
MRTKITQTNEEVNSVEKDVAVILNVVTNIEEKIGDIKNRTTVNEKSINDTNIAFSALKERTSNLAIFQSVFSLIIGAIATFIAYSLK